MAKLPSLASINLSVLLPPPPLPPPSLLTLKSPPNAIKSSEEQRQVATSASRSGGVSLNSILKSCKTCSGKGAIECPGCKCPGGNLKLRKQDTSNPWILNNLPEGTGKNKKNGNIFERWKCFECQGFGLKGCPSCGKGGLTPEQRGER